MASATALSTAIEARQHSRSATFEFPCQSPFVRTRSLLPCPTIRTPGVAVSITDLPGNRSHVHGDFTLAPQDWHRNRLTHGIQLHFHRRSPHRGHNGIPTTASSSRSSPAERERPPK